MRRKRLVWIAVSVLLAFALAATWFLGSLGAINIKTATHAEIMAAVDSRVRYEPRELDYDHNAWLRIQYLFADSSRSEGFEFVPPLNARCQEQIKPFLEEWRRE